MSAWGQTSTFASDKNATYTCGQVLKNGSTDILNFTLGGLDGTDTWNPNGGNKGLKTGTAAVITDGTFVSGTYYIVTPTKDLKLDLNMYMPDGNSYFYVDKSDAIGTHLYSERRPNGSSQSNWRSLSCEKLLAGSTYYVYSTGAGAGINSFTATTYEDYSIHYVDNSATPVTIKSDVEHEGLYGAEVTASESDMANVTYNERVYSYASGNETITLGTGTNEITLVYAIASQYDYTINAVSGGSIIQELATGTLYQGETYGVYLKEVMNIDSKPYVLDDAGNANINTYYAGYTMGDADATHEINYTIDNDVVAFFECENMTYSHNHYQTLSANQAASRYTASNGNAVCMYSANSITTTTKVPAGAYEIGLNVCYKWRDNITSVKLQYSTDKTEWNDITTLSCAGGVTGMKNVIAVLPADSYLRLLDVTGATPSHFFDYLIVKKAYVSGTIASRGYSSFASSYGLDFANATGLSNAFVVTNITKDAVMLSSVDELPANSGVILKGTGGAAYNIPVKADATYDGTNKLYAAVEAYDCAANEVYILQGGLFHLVTAASTVPAGKAYLKATDVPNEARSLGFLFGDDEVTSINSVSRDIQDGEFYNLQGQRVDSPKKGLYIVNGRKVLVK